MKRRLLSAIVLALGLWLIYSQALGTFVGDLGILAVYIAGLYLLYLLFPPKAEQ